MHADVLCLRYLKHDPKNRFAHRGRFDPRHPGEILRLRPERKSDGPALIVPLWRRRVLKEALVPKRLKPRWVRKLLEEVPARRERLRDILLQASRLSRGWGWDVKQRIQLLKHRRVTGLESIEDAVQDRLEFAPTLPELCVDGA